MKTMRWTLCTLLVSGLGQLLWPESPSRVEKHALYSPVLGMTRYYNIYLPPGYDESGERYPVIYFFRNHEDEWFNTTSHGGRALKEVADSMITLGLTGKMILVAPNTGSNDGQALGLGINYLHPELAVSAVGTGRLEDHIIGEMIAHIDSAWRTIADREHRGTDGFSSGGTPALVLAMHHPDLFISVGSFDGDFMWYNLDNPGIPGEGPDDPYWIKDTYNWYQAMYAPIFGWPRDIPYMLTHGPANIVMSADEAALARIQQMRFHIETLPPATLTNGAVNAQLIGVLEEKDLLNTFRDPVISVKGEHSWFWADCHAAHSLVRHWQTFAAADWQIAVASSSSSGFSAVGDTDTMEVTLFNTTARPASVTAVTNSHPSFRLADASPLPIRLESLRSTAALKILCTPDAAGDLEDIVEIQSGDAGKYRARMNLRIKSYHFAPARSSLLYAAATNDNILKSIDLQNATVHPIASFGTDIRMNALSIRPSDNHLVGVSSGVAKTDFYRICSQNGYAKLLCTVPIPRILGIAFDAQDSLFAGAADGKLYRIDLRNGAAALIGTAPGIVFGGLAFHPQSGELYASVRTSGTGKDNIYRVSTVNADTTLVGATGDGKVATALFFDPSGTLYGLKGSPGQENTLITIDQATGVGTSFCSLGKSNLIALAMIASTTSVEPAPAASQPGGWALLPNFPNPFNAQTTIRLDAGRRGATEIALYNMLGERVTTLFSGTIAAGRHEVVWTGTDAQGRPAPSGIYLIRMSAPGYNGCRKMLLLR